MKIDKTLFGRGDEFSYIDRMNDRSPDKGAVFYKNLALNLFLPDAIAKSSEFAQAAIDEIQNEKELSQEDKAVKIKGLSVRGWEKTKEAIEQSREYCIRRTTDSKTIPLTIHLICKKNTLKIVNHLLQQMELVNTNGSRLVTGRKGDPLGTKYFATLDAVKENHKKLFKQEFWDIADNDLVAAFNDFLGLSYKKFRRTKTTQYIEHRKRANKWILFLMTQK